MGLRFLISSDRCVAAAVFILYGSQFARLLELPETPSPRRPVLHQLPARYRDLFLEGCNDVLLQPEPARFNGAVRHDGDVELYRAAFMPLRGKDATRPLIYGTFNRRAVPVGALKGLSVAQHPQAARLFGRPLAP